MIDDVGDQMLNFPWSLEGRPLVDVIFFSYRSPRLKVREALMPIYREVVIEVRGVIPERENR